MRLDVTAPPPGRSRARQAVMVFVGLIYLIAFRVSFASISAFAGRQGVFPPGEQWMAPIMVDALAMAAMVLAVARSIDGERAWYAWGMVVGANLASVVLNVAHAQPTTSSRLVAAGVPLVAMASLGLVEQEYRSLRRRKLEAEEKARLEAERVQVERERKEQIELRRIEAQARVEQAKPMHVVPQLPHSNGGPDGSDAATVSIGEANAARRKIVVEAVDAADEKNRRVDVDRLADETGRSKRWVYDVMKEHRNQRATVDNNLPPDPPDRLLVP